MVMIEVDLLVEILRSKVDLEYRMQNYDVLNVTIFSS
jgi:hypothetical protein